ncbi:MAG: hypothetical protein AB8F26_08380 [Phycisphaerales bacterium]
MRQSFKNFVRTATTALATGVVFGMTSNAQAQSNKAFTYQGVASRTDGQSVGATVNCLFILYRTETGGSSIDDTAMNNIPVSEAGLFTVELDFGDTDRNDNPLYNGDDLYLEIWINGTPLTPRQRITAAPIALGIPGAYSIGGNQLRLGENMNSVVVGEGSQATNLSLLNGSIAVNTPSNVATVLDSTSTIGTWLSLRNSSTGGNPWAIISAGSANGEGPGSFVISDQSAGAPRMVINSAGNVGFGVSNPTERLDVGGAIRIRGADIVEGFDSSTGKVIEAGTVVSIDPTPGQEGRLMPSSEAYDSKVAGVVSGAGGLPYGMSLAYDGQFDGDTKVAMTGRVYVKCSTEGGPIRPGDLLTTASLEGHAMKATDRDRAHGTVIGKAMSTLDGETGLVLVLVNLQ